MTSAPRSLFGLATLALYVLASLVAGLAHAPLGRSARTGGGDPVAIASALCAHGSASDDAAPLLPFGSCDACVLMAAASLPPAAPSVPWRAFARMAADTHSEAPAPHRPGVARPTSRGPPVLVA
jgi:hypothetical protein